jgi:hypothetical protein
MSGWRPASTGLKLCAALAAGVLMAGSPGVRPRAAATDYPVHQSARNFTVGATLIARKDVKKIFAADLNGGGYIVVEVGVYPQQGSEVDLSPGDFMLRVDDGRVVRPVDADAIAASIGRQHERPAPRQSDVYTTTGVIIARAPGVDPATGRASNRTVVGTEAGVGIGGPPSNCRFSNNCDDGLPYPATYPSAAPNRGAIEQELWEKSLPDGKTAVAIAGYLYFPKPAHQNSTLELMMDGRDGRLKLLLPPEK